MTYYRDQVTGHQFVVDPDDGNHVVWTSDGKLVHLIPSAKIELLGGSALSLTWPDFQKGIAYRFDIGAPPPPPQTAYCVSFATRAGGTWGPGEANNLDAIALGTVPSGTDYLDVRAKVTRTSAPSARFGNVPVVQCKEGEWIDLPGGACPLEGGDAFYHRGFIVVRSGTAVSLERRQTIDDSVKAIYTVDQDQGVTHHPTFIYSGSAGNRGEPMAIIQHKPSNDGGNVNKNQTGVNACSVSDPTNFGAVYSTELIITPGRYQN